MLLERLRHPLDGLALLVFGLVAPFVCMFLVAPGRHGLETANWIALLLGMVGIVSTIAGYAWFLPSLRWAVVYLVIPVPGAMAISGVLTGSNLVILSAGIGAVFWSTGRIEALLQNPA